MWFKNKSSAGGGSRTRSCSGPFQIQRIGSEDVIRPHHLAISVPSALSNADPTSIETISSEDNAVVKGKKLRESKSRFLRQPKKHSQGRTVQKIKHWRDGRSGSVSSSEDLPRNAEKTLRSIFGESRKSRGRSFSSSTTLSSPLHDLQMFGSVPPTPTFNDDVHPRFSSNGSGFRNKSATLPNTNGSNLVSIFGNLTIDKLDQVVGRNATTSSLKNRNSSNSFDNCPCSSCKEKRWPDVGSHYQFPARSQSDWNATQRNTEKKGLYYNSNPATGIEVDLNELPPSTEKKAFLTKRYPIREESVAFVYANLGAIQNANGEIIKSKINHKVYEVNNWSRRATGKSFSEFRSLPKNFVKPLHHLHKIRTASDSEALTGMLTDVLCPCCGNVFHYNISKEIARANLRRRGLALSEPATPTGFLRNNPLHDIFKASKLLSLIPSAEVASDTDYLKPNKSEQKIDDHQAARIRASAGTSLDDSTMSEVQLLHLVPPPQCHNPEAVIKANTYENGEYWRIKNQSNVPEGQMNYLAYVTSDSNGGNQSGNSKQLSGDPDKDSIQSPENLDEQTEEEETKADFIPGVDVTKYEIRRDRTTHTVPNIYLRPRPQNPSASFPYVWPASPDEPEDGFKFSKFVNAGKRSAFSRLPPLKENVTFYT